MNYLRNILITCVLLASIPTTTVLAQETTSPTAIEVAERNAPIDWSFEDLKGLFTGKVFPEERIDFWSSSDNLTMSIDDTGNSYDINGDGIVVLDLRDIGENFAFHQSSAGAYIDNLVMLVRPGDHTHYDMDVGKLTVNNLIILMEEFDATHSLWRFTPIGGSRESVL